MVRGRLCEWSGNGGVRTRFTGNASPSSNSGRGCCVDANGGATEPANADASPPARLGEGTRRWLNGSVCSRCGKGGGGGGVSGYAENAVDGDEESDARYCCCC